MTPAVFGVYQNGRITLDEALPLTIRKARVVVVVIEEISDAAIETEQQLGSTERKISPANDPATL